MAKEMGVLDLQLVVNYQKARPHNPYFSNEVRFQSAVQKWIEGSGWMTYHTTHSLHSTKGFPDIHAVHPQCGCLIVAELKSEGTKAFLSPEQASWVLAYARNPEHYVWVWKPSDEEEIMSFLKAHQDDLTNGLCPYIS